MTEDRQIERMYKTMEKWRRGLLLDEETDLLSMIILAYHLKNTNHPQADEITADILDFLLGMDEDCSLHYSLWLAFAPLVSEKPLDFFGMHRVRAVQEDYDPFASMNPVFYGSPFDEDVYFPVSIYSSQLKNELEECLAARDAFSAALMKWMLYEDEVIRKAVRFVMEDVVSFSFSFSGSVCSMDEVNACKEDEDCTLRYLNEEGEEKNTAVHINYRYEDMTAAVSSERPLQLYLIDHMTGKLCCYDLSPSEFAGFHVGMFILDEVSAMENGKIRAVLYDPKGKRYELNGEIEKEYNDRSISTKLLFPDGVIRKTDLYPRAQHPFALMDLNQGYTDLLKKS